MIWVSIILGIIQAIPELITLFKWIADHLHGHPLQAVHEGAFTSMLAAYHSGHKDPARLEADLSALKSSMIATAAASGQTLVA